LTNSSPDLYASTLRIVLRKNNLFLARLPGISAIRMKIRHYNFQIFADISGNGNITFPKNLQP